MVSSKAAAIGDHASDPGKVRIIFGKPLEERVSPPEMLPTMKIEWWLKRADFYDEDWMPFIRYFDSWE